MNISEFSACVSELYTHMDEELADASEYINCAYKHQKDNKTLADTYYKLAKAETEHYQILSAVAETSFTEMQLDSSAVESLNQWIKSTFNDKLTKIMHKINQYK